MAGNFVLNWSDDGMKAAIVINDMSIDSSSTSLTLFGRGVVDYGEKLQENLLRITENFCSGVPPQSPSRGQLWYDASTTRMKLWTGGVWATTMVDDSLIDNHTSNQTIHVTPSQRGILDGLTVSATELNLLAGLSNTVASMFATELAARTGNDSTIISNLNDHATNTNLHLTSAQHNWLEAITVSAADLNLLGGTTSSIQSQIDNRLQTTGGVLSGPLSITVAATQPYHVVTKQYVDDLAAGLDPKESVLLGSTVDLPATLVGDTLTASANGLLILDGSTPALGTRVLIKNQANRVQNGVFTVANQGSSSSQWVLNRTADFVNGKVTSGAYMFIETGSTLADSAWVLSSDGLVIVGSTELAFVQFNGGGAVSIGAGLYKNGSVIEIAPSGVASGTYNSVTVGTDGRVTAGFNLGYLTQNQTINITGAATGSGTTSIMLTLAEIGIAPGSYTKVTVNSKGLVYGYSALAELDIPDLSWSKITTGKPTTIAGYGITDAVLLSSVTPSAPTLAGQAGSALTAARADHAHPLQVDVSGTANFANQLKTNRLITGAGDVSFSIPFDGSADVVTTTSLIASGVVPGTYSKVAVNSKGIVTAGNFITAADIPALDWSKITTSKPTTIAGYGIVIDAGDIPSLDWSKITTGKPSTVGGYGITIAAADVPALDWSKITTGKPTTLAGYGITDAASISYTSVQQGGGTNQLTNKIYIGWGSANALRLQVDTTDYGSNWPINIGGNATTATRATTATNADSATTALTANLATTATTATTATSATTAGSATTATTATYLSGVQLNQPVIGKSASMSMSQDGGATQGSFIAKATGAGDANLAGITFSNDAYSIKLGVRADGYFGLGGWSRAAWSWYSDTNGNMVAAGDVTAYSDPRLKEDITVLDSALEKIQSIRGVRFKWKQSELIGKPGEYDVGVLADEVKAIAPEIVYPSVPDRNGTQYDTVAYNKLVPFLIEAVKELSLKIQSLEQQITDLKK